MNSRDALHRRKFLGTIARAGAVAALAPAPVFAAAGASAGGRFKLIAFTKPFRTLNADESADLVAEVGWDGVELPVRARSEHIKPEEVEDRLPGFVEAFRKRGREITMITTDIVSVSPLNEKVLRTASRLGIKRYRLGSLHYAKGRPIPEQLHTMAAQLRELAALNQEAGIQGGYQNHSGSDYVGAPIWDVWMMIKDLDPRSLGLCFDIGHATIEGGLSWPIEARLAEPWLTAVFVKDFRWEKTERRGRVRWCPLGEGMVAKSYFDGLRTSKFSGPICQHHEYEMGDRAQMIAHFKKDLAVLREWLA